MIVTITSCVANIRPNSPADKAGLLPGDFIYKVDYHKVTDVTQDVVEKHIRNAGTAVTLSLDSVAVKMLVAGSPLLKVRDKPFLRAYKISEYHNKMIWNSSFRSRDLAYYRVGDIKEVRFVRHVMIHTSKLAPELPTSLLTWRQTRAQDHVVPAVVRAGVPELPCAHARGPVLLAGHRRGVLCCAVLCCMCCAACAVSWITGLRDI